LQFKAQSIEPRAAGALPFPEIAGLKEGPGRGIAHFPVRRKAGFRATHRKPLSNDLLRFSCGSLRIRRPACPKPRTYIAPFLEITAGMVFSRIFKSNHRDQWSM
jgi:hypothetical protein